MIRAGKVNNYRVLALCQRHSKRGAIVDGLYVAIVHFHVQVIESVTGPTDFGARHCNAQLHRAADSGACHW